MIQTPSAAPPFPRVLFLVAIVLVLRLVYAALFAENPAGDEAYYWDWGRRLDYGYYSKPPFIAWLYALVDWIGGGSLFAIRATAALLGTGSLLLLHRLAYDLFDARTAWIALLLGLATPANAVLSFFLTIDAPLVVCWSTALIAFWRHVTGPASWKHMPTLFVALSVGHLCKQMMMVFPILAVLFLATSGETRSHLKRGSFWLILFGSYLSLIPPLLWNARHDWITFQHTGHHFEVKESGGSPIVERLGDFLSFLGTQLGVLSPGTAFLVFALCLGGLRFLSRAPRPQRYLLVFGALPLAFMLLLSLRQALQPNWAAVFYLPGIVLVAGWYADRVPARFPPGSWKRLLPATLSVGFLLCGFFYAAPPVFKASGSPGHPLDPNRRLSGYESLSREVEAVRGRLPGGADAPFLLVVGHRDYASQLAFGLPDQPRVYNLDLRPGIDSQYEMWNRTGNPELLGRNGLVLLPATDRFPRVLRPVFESSEPLGTIHVRLQDEEKVFSLFLGKNLRAWPEA